MKHSRLLIPACALLLAAAPASAQDEPSYSASSIGNSSTREETRLSRLEEQMRTLNGRIEQVEYSQHHLEQLLQRIQSDTDARLTKLESAPTAAPVAQPTTQPIPLPTAQQPAAQLQPVPLTQQDATQPVVDANGTLGAIKMQNGKVVGGVNNPQSPPLPATPPDYGLTPQEQYERAFNLLRQANYPEAEQAFKSFIDKNPKDKLIDNAKYWYGETLYVRARFDEAAVAFADAYQQDPRGNKAPDSLLKLAMSLAALNKTSDACVTLAELKAKYPAASATIKARAEEERTQLKCPTR
ncbi:MAG: tol-pal system protein YbgF [Alphaproteobacteria bacterium]|nr:tol-pal system protein YbgF [Alphaproteobacteria bacterium]